jgi:hypothetical protein
MMKSTARRLAHGLTGAQRTVPYLGKTLEPRNLELAGCHACDVGRDALLVVTSTLTTLLTSPFALHLLLCHGVILCPVIGLTI